MINLVAFVRTDGNATTINGGTSAPIDTTGANLLVAWVCGWINFGVLTDSKGNIWTSLPQRNNGNNGGRWVYCTAPVVGSGHTFTVSSISYPSWTVYAFSGINTLQIEVFASGDNTTSVASGSVTPAADGSLVLAAFTGGTVPTVSVAPAELVSTLQQNTSGSNANKGATAYVIQTTAAAINPTWSWTGTLFNTLADTIVFATGAPTAAGQVAQLPVEVLVLPSAPVQAQLAQLPLEVLVLGVNPSARVSQVVTEVMFAAPPPDVRLTQVAVEVLWQPSSNQPARLSQVAVEVLYLPGAGGGVGGEKVYVFLD